MEVIEVADLTTNQDKFIAELIKGKSQREAFRIAYPNSITWTDNAVDANASKLFAQRKVKLRYNKLIDKVAKESEEECIFDVKRWMEQVVAIATVDVTEVASVETVVKDVERVDNETGELVAERISYKNVLIKDTKDLTQAQRKAIKSIKQGRYGVEIELYAKDKSLEMLGRTLGLFKDKIDVNHTGTLKLEDFINGKV
jgi:phage terminase small subunit